MHADMGQIQQVLYNLIDNAIKFSPEDSVIKVESTLKHETVFISVKIWAVVFQNPVSPKSGIVSTKLTLPEEKTAKALDLDLPL